MSTHLALKLTELADRIDYGRGLPADASVTLREAAHELGKPYVVDNFARLGLRTVMTAQELLAHKPAVVPFVAVQMWDDIEREASHE